MTNPPPDPVETAHEIAHADDLLAKARTFGYAAASIVVVTIVLFAVVIILARLGPRPRNSFAAQPYILLAGGALTIVSLVVAVIHRDRAIRKTRRALAERDPWTIEPVAPAEGENYFGHHVLESTPHVLHVAQPRFRSLVGIMRLAALLLAIAVAGGATYGIIFHSRRWFRYIKLVFAAMGIGAWSMRTFTLQWLAESESDEGPRLTIEIVRFFFFRRATVLPLGMITANVPAWVTGEEDFDEDGDEPHPFETAERTPGLLLVYEEKWLHILDRAGGLHRLSKVGGDAAAVYRARRLSEGLSQVLVGAPCARVFTSEGYAHGVVLEEQGDG